MAKASDNAFPSILITEGTEPSAPAAGKQRLYIDSTTHKLKRTDSSGTDVTIESTAGSVATDTIWDAAGDLAVGSGADTAAKLSIGATNGMAVQRVSGAVAWALPPGYEFDYVQFTSNVSITATTEAGADVVVTSGAVTYDGSTAVIIEAFSPAVVTAGGAAALTDFYLYQKVGAGAAASIGLIAEFGNVAAGNGEVPLLVRRRMTPSAASIIYSIRARVSAGSGLVVGGSGGAAANLPGYIRITKV